MLNQMKYNINYNKLAVLFNDCFISNNKKIIILKQVVIINIINNKNSINFWTFKNEVKIFIYCYSSLLVGGCMGNL